MPAPAWQRRAWPRRGSLRRQSRGTPCAAGVSGGAKSLGLVDSKPQTTAAAVVRLPASAVGARARGSSPLRPSARGLRTRLGPCSPFHASCTTLRAFQDFPAAQAAQQAEGCVMLTCGSVPCVHRSGPLIPPATSPHPHRPGRLAPRGPVDCWRGIGNKPVQVGTQGRCRRCTPLQPARSPSAAAACGLFEIPSAAQPSLTFMGYKSVWPQQHAVKSPK